MTVRSVAGFVRACRRSFHRRGKIAAGAAPTSGGGIRHGGGARLSPRVFLCFPLACVVVMSGRVHAVAPMLDSRIARSCLRVRTRGTFIVPSASPGERRGGNECGRSHLHGGEG